MKRLCLLILLVGCSHEAKRENPLDPVRTQAVELSLLRYDNDKAEVVLIWSRYAGAEPFEAYIVRRRTDGETAWTVLQTVTALDDTLFVNRDIPAGFTYDYSIDVASAGGGLSSSDLLQVSLVAAQPHLRVVFDDATGSARLIWSQVVGGYAGYEIRRTDLGTGQIRVVFTTDVSADTTFVDRDLQPDTDYEYQVTALSATRRDVPSNTDGGSYHEFIAAWEIPAGCRFIAIDADDVIHLATRTTPTLYRYTIDGILLSQIALADPVDYEITDLASDTDLSYVLYTGKTQTWPEWSTGVWGGYVMAVSPDGDIRYRFPSSGDGGHLSALAASANSLWIASSPPLRANNLSVGSRSTILHLDAPTGALMDSVQLNRSLWWGFDIHDGRGVATVSGGLGFAADGGAAVFDPVLGGRTTSYHRTEAPAQSFITGEVISAHQLAMDAAWSVTGDLYLLYAPRIVHNRLPDLQGQSLQNTPHVETMRNQQLLSLWGRPGEEEGQLDDPHGIVTDSSGRVYILDGERIQVFAPEPSTPTPDNYSTRCFHIVSEVEHGTLHLLGLTVQVILCHGRPGPVGAGARTEDLHQPGVAGRAPVGLVESSLVPGDSRLRQCLRPGVHSATMSGRISASSNRSRGRRCLTSAISANTRSNSVWTASGRTSSCMSRSWQSGRQSSPDCRAARNCLAWLRRLDRLGRGGRCLRIEPSLENA